MKIRHQLAVYSPVPASAIIASALASFGRGDDRRPTAVRLLRELFVADSCALCDSGTHALQLAIETARKLVGAHARIAIPAFTCFDVATAAIAAGGEVSLYDIDPGSLGPDMGSLEAALLAGAKVVVVAALYGLPLHWEALESLAREYGAVLIEDAAQGHGASLNGRAVGSFGQITTLSFGRGKGWTSGGGGALLLRGASVAANIPDTPSLKREMIGVAGLITQAVLGRPWLYGIPRGIPALHLGETTYVEPTAPCGMSRAAAATLMATQAASQAEASARARNAMWLLDALSGLAGVRTARAPVGGLPGYLRLPVMIEGGMESLRDVHGARRLGIEGSYPIPLTDLTPLAPVLVNRSAAFPGAGQLARDLITLPTHSHVSSVEYARIVAALREATSKCPS
jgi:perosamine synthetase